MAGGQITFEFGFCPYGYRPQCCAAVVSYLLGVWLLEAEADGSGGFRWLLGLIRFATRPRKSMSLHNRFGRKRP